MIVMANATPAMSQIAAVHQPTVSFQSVLKRPSWRRASGNILESGPTPKLSNYNRRTCFGHAIYSVFSVFVNSFQQPTKLLVGHREDK